MVKSGDRKKRLSKRERIERDSRIKEVRPVYITGLSSRIASRVVGKVLNKENIVRIEKEAFARVQSALEREVEGLIVMKMRNDAVEVPPDYESGVQEEFENDESVENEESAENADSAEKEKE